MQQLKGCWPLGCLHERPVADDAEREAPMPVVLRVGSYVFQFWASDRSEPPHVHVRSGRRKAKYWLVPQVRLARNQGFKSHELTVIRALMVEHTAFFLEQWHVFFGDR